MSRRCGYKLTNITSVSTLYRRTLASEVLQHKCRNISTSTRKFKDNHEKHKDNNFDKENSDTDKPNIGFFARVKEGFIKDFQSKEENKKSFEALQKQSEKLHSHYDKYIGSKLPSFKSTNIDETNSEKLEQENVSFGNKINTLKSRLDKERLTEDYNRIIRNTKEISESSINRFKSWHEKNKETHEKSQIDNEQIKVNEEQMSGDKKNNIVQKRFSEMFEKSGLANNLFYQKAVEQTSSVLNAKKEKFTGISAAATTALKTSKEELGKKVDELGKKVDETRDVFEKSGVREALDKGKEALAESERIARETADRIAKEKQEFQNSEQFKKVTEVTQETMRTTVEDFYNPMRLKESETYKSPEQLKKRIEEEAEEEAAINPKDDPSKIKIDEETVGITEHKGWKWDTSWKNFKEQTPLVQKLMQFRESLEESDNIFARAGYKVYDSLSGVVTGMMQPSEISTTIAEIQKIDPRFDITLFSTTLRFDIVPNVVEAYLRSDIQILENWCQERALGQFKHMLAAREFKGTIRLIDIGECEILTGIMLEDLGPVFMFNVQTQQLFSEIVHSETENGEATQVTQDAIKVVVYTIAVCRDQTMLDPTAAWTVLEVIEHVTNEDYDGQWKWKSSK